MKKKPISRSELNDSWSNVIGTSQEFFASKPVEIAKPDNKDATVKMKKSSYVQFVEETKPDRIEAIKPDRMYLEDTPQPQADVPQEEYADETAFLSENPTPTANFTPMFRSDYSGDDNFMPLGGLQPTPRKRRKLIKDDEEWEVEKTYTPSDEMVYAATEPVTPSDVEDFADIKDSIRILRSPERTLVFAIVVDRENKDANVMSAIRCRGGTPFGGYAYDRSRDAYVVQCVDFIEIGNIPFSFMQTMDKVGTWQVRIPIPESVLEKHFTPHQRRVVSGYGKKYQAPKFEIQYIQMLGCH